MDAYTVQQYVADWLNAGSIPGLDKVHPALTDAQAINLAEYGSGTMRCQAVVYVEGHTDVRRTLPIHYGVRQVTWRMRLEIGHSSAEPDWQQADRALKTDIVGGVITMIRKDPALGSKGAPDPLFDSAGEGLRGVQVDYGDPDVDDNTGERVQWAYLYFDVLTFETA